MPGYVMRLKGNDVIDGLAAPHLEGDQPSDECYHELRYRAKCWSVERRVVLVVVPVPGELFPRHFYLITDLDVEAYPAEQLVLTSPSGQGKTLSSASNSLVFPS